MSTASSTQPPPVQAIPRQGFLKQVILLAGPYWKCEHCWKVRGAAALLLILTIGQVALSVWSNYWRGALFDALEQHSISRLLIQIGVFVLIFLLSIVITGGHLLIKRWLQMDWRAWLTDQLVNRWMEGGRFYRLLHTPGDHDNPDQRIAEDIRIATEIAVALWHTLVYSLLSVGLFIDILWSVSGSVNIPGTGIHIPGYMVILAFLYAALGSVFGWMMGRPLVSSTNALQNAEATFRFGLSRVRENPEAIALMRGEPLEKNRSSNRFLEIIRQWNRQSMAYMGLVAFGTGYGLLLPIFPILVAAPQYIRGVMTLGLLMQAAEAFQRLTSALSWPVDNIGEMARCRASAERVLSLYQAMQDVDDCGRGSGHVCIVVERSQRSRLVIQNLCIAEPSGRVLLEHFHADFRRGERVLLTGDPEVTSSLFKVLAGLWLWGSGKVITPPIEDMMFITQRPFLYEGVLREVLCYPHPADGFDPSVVRHALECSGLAWIASRLDDHDNWEQVLPQRSQQRLCFARALIQKPSWICMQEVLDAFSPKGARIVFEMLRRELPNTTLLNISFQAGLRTLHHRTVALGRARSAKMLEPDDSEESGGF
ncbi:MAG: ABC transporter ATP-binding protein/permease [Thermodesulfobacteriota bacterium]